MSRRHAFKAPRPSPMEGSGSYDFPVLRRRVVVVRVLGPDHSNGAGADEHHRPDSQVELNGDQDASRSAPVMMGAIMAPIRPIPIPHPTPVLRTEVE